MQPRRIITAVVPLAVRLLNHLVWFVLAAVEELDLSAFYAAYRQDANGRPAHDPAMMVALLLYAYARGQRSSRVIERECVEDVAFRVIAANQRPDRSLHDRTVSPARDRDRRADLEVGYLLPSPAGE